ncbi:hypothetical protein GCM10007989_19790 [Devosia pacifica]|uniref:Heme exporter protein D n=1 Tax=Devosia pacifica TaxID=1335967 RepID=A0A918VU35_9HYPH|nr:heme exporter protein CcmD [Devosia pacifica]GHA24175.1 hypothetical protein GCM10007989_19790 [Devosia pacifica]
MAFDLGPHAVFIIAAYLGVATVVAALIGYRTFEARSVSRRLSLLEEASGRKRAQ